MKVQWVVQGPAGPVPAPRPPAELLAQLGEQPGLAFYYMGAFTFDAVIDLWGWPYHLVMGMRRTHGYTWVPALGMPPVLVAPGVYVPGYPPYDAARPPMGAILVPPTDLGWDKPPWLPS